METGNLSYDQQARGFDARAGLSDSIAREVAETVLRCGVRDSRGSVLEIGVGTGEIGRWLCLRDRRYIGIDSSSAMLDEFRARMPDTELAKLICADANEPWPVDTDSVRLIFGSRVFHLLNVEHVLAEISRVIDRQGATLLLGKVLRCKDSIKALMRNKMRELLLEHGAEPRQADEKRRQLLEQSLTLGGIRVEPLEAASWQARNRPVDSIQAWRNKRSMGGITPSAEIKEDILARLAKWAAETFGDLEREFVTEEKYVLEGTRFSAHDGNLP